ncbi:MAG TPA: sigma-70 family RNA polymerase sigma factor [Pirellulaceae bacterium]|nr:sigma-70 family RNA polymerase sigma factor [Pirellulaceae bacterium]HMO93023.1 sigma-70 family RNA polymerase sigma factor [Pirellulaceae bacterium]HMP69653.1 sigma-70 family RNA polymerase sigma factor [Pirellulaceae bacterium]
MAEGCDRDADYETFDQLLTAARGGNRQALDRLISDCRDYLLLVANQELDVELQAKLGASDLVQQTLADIPASLGKFRGGTREEFLGWLRQALHHDLLDARRRYKTSKGRDVNREKALQDSAGYSRAIVDQLATPASQALLEEQGRLLNSAMEQLAPMQRKIIELRNWSQLSFVEIGEQMEISADAARKTWYRAIVRLQELLRPQFDSAVMPQPQDKEPVDESQT